MSRFSPLRLAKGMATAALFYPLAEALERRDVRRKVAGLRRHHKLSPAERAAVSRARLGEILAFADANVPYYRDLFARLKFDTAKAAMEPARLAELPLLTKDIILAEGERMLSRPLAEIRHHACKTGGSTGEKAVIYYDQEAADHSSAVTAYARERVGATRFQPTLHFAAHFLDAPAPKRFDREWFKCLAMNRSNIFFDKLDAAALDDIWATIRQRAPYLVHAHPSTIDALAQHVRARGDGQPDGRPVFAVFESSGEVLDARQRRDIAEAFGCRVVDRYGLAEFGVLAYELSDRGGALEVFDSECWTENVPAEGQCNRLVVTSYRNRLMPLIRYDTGDLAELGMRDGVPVLTGLVGRVHDMIELNGVPYLTHHLQDVLDHRVGGIRDFQFDLRTPRPTLRLVLEPGADAIEVASRIGRHWPDAFTLAFVGPEDMVRVGDRAKFRHVVTA